MNATTPADLGLRAQLLVDKHAEYIKSFGKPWEVSSAAFAGRHHAPSMRCLPAMPRIIGGLAPCLCARPHIGA